MRYLSLILGFTFSAMGSSLPSKFDLRDATGNFVSSVKSQKGGTCWTHAVAAAMESNLMLTGVWDKNNESGEAALAEYHLDWWNGFNKHFNSDISPSSGGLTVHQGGDYRVAAAYLSRGAGMVREKDGQSYNKAPKEYDSGYHYYYAPEIEWLTVGENLEHIEDVKQAIYDHGAIGTALAWTTSLYSSSSNSFYQPKSSSKEANHAVTIVGWDDNKKTKAPNPGAWIVKNSWGTSWGSKGYFYISYYDKVSGRHDQMGAVSYKNVDIMPYDNVYYHDYHGWRDTKEGVELAANRFVAKSSSEVLSAVSFYTAAKDVEYHIDIYDDFDGQEFSKLLSAQSGVSKFPGLHTVDLHWPFALRQGEDFYVVVRLLSGGHPYDKTSDVPVLLGAEARVIVKSSANKNESFYWNGSAWKDLTEDDDSANFTIKALTNNM